MNNQRIGIWGLGAVGKSAINFFHLKGNQLEILNLDAPTAAILQNLPEAIRYTQQRDNNSIHTFLERNDVIIVSPGINIIPFTTYAHKFITELDIVAHSTNIPLIGITGTIGKTTVTTLLSKFLQKLGYSIGTGGNIGTPMLDLLSHARIYDYLVLELSSFQLEYTRACAPTLAIWTNFYPNHLDRHQTMQDYFRAKCNIFLHQTNKDFLLLPLQSIFFFQEYGYNITNIKVHLSFFSLQKPSEFILKTIFYANFYYFNDNTIVVNTGNQESKLISLNFATLKIYPENLLILAAALHYLRQPLDIFISYNETLQLEDRLEYVGTHNNIHFYNDSKATIMQATQNALHALAGHTIILLLGGISKGVDRTEDIQALEGKVSYVICFGKEAEKLHKICSEVQIPSDLSATLEEAFNKAILQAQAGNTILLSPGGASFDLFANYKERGNRFKELIATNFKLSKFRLNA